MICFSVVIYIRRGNKAAFRSTSQQQDLTFSHPEIYTTTLTTQMKLKFLYTGIFSIPESSLYRNPLYIRIFSIPESSLYQGPLYTRILSIPESFLYRNPLYTGILSIPESSLYQTLPVVPDLLISI